MTNRVTEPTEADWAILESALMNLAYRNEDNASDPTYSASTRLRCREVATEQWEILHRVFGYPKRNVISNHFEFGESAQ